MATKYDRVALCLEQAMSAAGSLGIEDRLLAKGGIQSLLIAHYLGHELNPVGQGYDASDCDGRRYEYKATNADKPQCAIIFSKHGPIDEAVRAKLTELYGIVFAVFRQGAVEVCYFAPSESFSHFAQEHFLCVESDVSAGIARRGRPRAFRTLESRTLNLSKNAFLRIPGVVEMRRVGGESELDHSTMPIG